MTFVYNVLTAIGLLFVTPILTTALGFHEAAVCAVINFRYALVCTVFGPIRNAAAKRRLFSAFPRVCYGRASPRECGQASS
jgi:hypothetical protein